MVAVGRLLHCLLGMVLLLAAGLASAGTAYVFDGRAVPNCSYTNSSKEYACSALPLSNYQDSVEIANNTKVISTQAVVFGYSQGLKMSGSARLVSYGDIDISGIQSSLLQVSGGSFLTDRAFRMGALSHNITASIKADDIYLGTGSTGSVTGTIEATRTVTIASHMTVTGNISGTVVTTNSPAKITGSVTASTSFSLASGSTMTGNISAPKVDLLASGVKLTGNITSTGAVTLGSGNTVTGSVIADTLALQDSSAYIGGNATVRSASLGYAGRVEGDIYCTAGNTAGNCDCVTNHSGYPVNSTSGPSCPYMARPGAHHFQISHPVAGVTCMPSTVTITACANSACTAPHYAGGASVTLLPGNKTFAINSTGINNAATVGQGSEGSATIATAPASSGMVCVGTGGTATTNDCKIGFAKSALQFELDDHVSGTTQAFKLKAVRSLNSTTCAPAFTGAKPVALGCTYVNPQAVTANIRAGIDNLAVRINSSTDLSCNGSTQSIDLTFDSAGVASATMRYADVGLIGLSASVASPALAGSDTVVVAPASFAVESKALGVIVTGAAFTRKITAKNTAGATTVNFGRESTPESVTMSRALCAPSPGGSDGTFTASVTGPASSGPRTGEGLATMTYGEVGLIDVIATLTSGRYLGSNLTVAGSTGVGGAACSGGGKVGRFIPHHFDVAIAQPLEFIYSGQPFVVTSVTARNHANATTRNYNGATYNGDTYAKLVTLTVHDAAGTLANPGPGTFRPALSPTTTAAVTIPAASFVSGVGSPATLPVYAFTNALTAPLPVRIRAVDADNVSSATGTEPTAVIRRGRLRLFGAFGRSNADLTLPFRTEFWTGQSWVVNPQDRTTAAVFPVAAVAMPAAPVPATAPRVISVSPLTAGQGNIVMRLGAANGAVDFAVNLGLPTDAGATQKNRSCLQAIQVANVGAAMPWLRSLNGACRATFDIDPAARATFGVIAPERRRVIHVREVFR